MNCVICASSSAEPPLKKAKVEPGSSEFCCAPCGHTFHRQCLYDHFQKEWDGMNILHQIFSKNSGEEEASKGPCPICQVQIKKSLLHPFIPTGQQNKSLDTTLMAMNILEHSDLDTEDPDDYWTVLQVVENVINWGNSKGEEKKSASEDLIRDIMTLTDPQLGALLFDADDECEEDGENEGDGENEENGENEEDGENAPELTKDDSQSVEENEEKSHKSPADEAESDSDEETIEQLYSMCCKDCKEKWNKSREATQDEDEGNQSDSDEPEGDMEDENEDLNDDESPEEDTGSGNISEAESL